MSICCARGLRGLRRPDAAGVGRQGGACVCGGLVVHEILQINLHAVAEGEELKKQRRSAECQQWSPEILYAGFMVDMADIAETVGDACQAQREGETNCRNGPAERKRRIEELLPWNNLPTDLKVQRECSEKYPHHGRPASEEEECATESTCQV